MMLLTALVKSRRLVLSTLKYNDHKTRGLPLSHAAQTSQLFY